MILLSNVVCARARLLRLVNLWCSWIHKVDLKTWIDNAEALENKVLNEAQDTLVVDCAKAVGPMEDGKGVQGRTAVVGRIYPVRVYHTPNDDISSFLTRRVQVSTVVVFVSGSQR